MRQKPKPNQKQRGSLTPIAITGGIAEGKSTVLQWLLEDGFSVASSDDSARAVLRDPGVRKSISSLAGLPVEFQSRELQSRMVEDPSVRRAVNHLMHPLISRMNHSISAQFYEVPLLIESCLYLDYDQVWVVSAGKTEQYQRLLHRVKDEKRARELVSLQLTSDVKSPFADVILRTNQPLERVREELRSAVCRLGPESLCSHR